MYHTDCSISATVSSIIEDNSWCIPDNIRRHIPEITELIEAIRIKGSEDDVVWAPSLRGKYTLKDTEEFMRKKGA